MKDIQNKLNEIDNKFVPTFFLCIGTIFSVFSSFMVYHNCADLVMRFNGVIKKHEETCDSKGNKCQTIIELQNGDKVNLGFVNHRRSYEGDLALKRMWSTSYKLGDDNYEVGSIASLIIGTILFLISVAFLSKAVRYKEKPH